MASRKRDDDTAMGGCIVYAVLGLILMPVIGLFLVCSKEPKKKTWGWILLIVGIILLVILRIGRT